jgi:transposase-like protein
MTIAACEEQIIRIKRASVQPEINEAVEAELQKQVKIAVQTTIEGTLEAELAEDLAARAGHRPRRSGFFQRVLDTQYGRIPDLHVPKLRWGNKQRQWRMLQRYQRGLSSFLGFALYLYVLGLSLRDLQEACYFLLGAVISRGAINRITLQVQARIDEQRLAPITETPPILIVDGVWVEVQYTLEEFKEDRAGHRRHARQAQERVILTALAVWPDGRYRIFHYEIAEDENEACWLAFFDHLTERGLDPRAVRLVVSDGANGLVAAMKQRLPQAQQQRCITPNVRGMERDLNFQPRPELDATGQKPDPAAAKEQRRNEIFHDAYAIYEAPTVETTGLNLMDILPYGPFVYHSASQAGSISLLFRKW